jgi:hypothetical protein
MTIKRGDLVESIKFKSIGVVIEVFDDLDLDNPWVRVLFTHPKETYQWVKAKGLSVITNPNLTTSLPKTGSL